MEINLPPTPGRNPLSETGPFVVKNVAMDLGPFPEELGMIKWPKPVQLSMSLSPPDSAPPKELVPFLLYGQVQVETGNVDLFRRGVAPSVLHGLLVAPHFARKDAATVWDNYRSPRAWEDALPHEPDRY